MTYSPPVGVVRGFLDHEESSDRVGACGGCGGADGL